MLEVIEALGLVGKIFIIAFFVFTFFELLFAILKLEILRKIIKPFCLSTLIVVASIVMPSHYLIYIGLIFGLIGDVILIRRNKLTLFFGMLAFLVQHLLIILEVFLNLLPYLGISFEWYIYLVLGIIYLAIIFIFYRLIKRATKSNMLTILGVNYMASILLIIGLMIATCFYDIYYAIIVLFGAILFFISDTLLTIGHYARRIPLYHFFVMLTYLGAQFLVVLGFALTYIG